MKINSYKCCDKNSGEHSSILSQLALLKLLADDNRLRLLCILKNGTHNVTQLVRHVGLSQSLTSHHLADLRAAGIVIDTRDGRQIFYSLTPKGSLLLRLLASLGQGKQ